MNEFISVITIDILFNLTPESRSPIAIEIFGWCFVLCMFTNLLIHLFFIVRNGFHDVKMSCKKKSYIKRYKVWYAALPEDKKTLYKTPQTIIDEIDDDPVEEKEQPTLRLLHLQIH